jgi:hypothetical protein
MEVNGEGGRREKGGIVFFGRISSLFGEKRVLFWNKLRNNRRRDRERKKERNRRDVCMYVYVCVCVRVRGCILLCVGFLSIFAFLLVSLTIFLVFFV